MIAGVDLVIGPLLTLLIYNTKKKGLKLDLALIGAAQVICLFFGSLIVYQERPVAVVFNGEVFYSVKKSSILGYLDEKDPNLSALDPFTPIYAYSPLPKSTAEKLQVALNALAGVPPLQYQIDKYRPYTSDVTITIYQGSSLNMLYKTHSAPEEVELISGWANKYGNQVVFYPLITSYGEFYLGLNGATGEVINALSIQGG